MMKAGFLALIVATFTLTTETAAFAPHLQLQSRTAVGSTVSKPFAAPLSLSNNKNDNVDDDNNNPNVHDESQEAVGAVSPLWAGAGSLLPALSVLTMSLPAEAATGGDPLLSAVAAYVHYLSLLVMAGCITLERALVKADMSDEDQDAMAIADISLGVSGTTLVVSGYYRITQYGKGWDFYSHEPVFWLKIGLVGIFGALSFFPTTKIIQRSVQKQQTGEYPPMTEKLASRMQTILNAELTALASIPLSATIMARGIGYNDGFPWQVEAGLAAAVFLGLGYKYIKEALTFEENSEPSEA